MDRKIKGFAVMLLSLILIIGFNSVGWNFILDTNVQWQHVWMIVALIGFKNIVYDK